MNGHRTDKSHTRVVRGVPDLIMAYPIVVLDSALKDSGSGSSSYYCRLDLRRWWLTITSIGVVLQEERFDYQAKSTDQLTEATPGLLPPWLQFLGSLSGLLESHINGSHLDWKRLSEEGGVDIEMYRLMKMLRSFDLRMKSLESFMILTRGEGLLLLFSRRGYVFLIHSIS